MSIKSIPYTEASPEQRRQYARSFLNLDIAADASDDQVSSRIEQAQPGVSVIFYQDAENLNSNEGAPIVAAPELTPEQLEMRAKMSLRPEEVNSAPTGSLGRGDPRAVIHIPRMEGPDGAMPINIGVNGIVWELKRGVDLPVPYRVVEALINAIRMEVDHVTNTQSGDVDVITRDSQRYPFQWIERPSEESIKRWHEQVDHKFNA